jgi:hypothetical protein
MRTTPLRSPWTRLLFALILPSRLACALETILKTATAAGDFKELLVALTKVGLAETFDGTSIFTVFAPTDAAFATMATKVGNGERPSRDLAEALTFHVASGSVMRSQLKDGMLIQTLQGAQLLVKVAAGVVTVGGVQVTKADIACSNGVIHVVDAVLLPPTRAWIDGGIKGWDQSKWLVQVDGVMGGRSSGSASFQNGAMVFSGSINLNGGGFSSVRKPGNLDLSSYAGLWVETGTTVYVPQKAPLTIHLQLRDTTGCSFAAPVALPLAMAQEKHRIFVPISQFDYGSQWGRSCAGLTLNAANVQAVEVYVLYQDGPFEVYLHEMSATMSAVDAPATPTMPVVPALGNRGAVAALLQSTIESGAPIYNKGYKGICAAMYASSMRSVLTALGTSQSAKGCACAALVKAAATTSKEDQAWFLRRAFDTIIADEAGNPRPSTTGYPMNIRGNWLPNGAVASKTAAEACSAWTANWDAGAAAAPPAVVSTPNKDMSSTNGMTGSGVSGNSVAGMDALLSFVGPFIGMGITDNNDWRRRFVLNPSECAEICRSNPECRSFDYGARGKVNGECWQSLATRDSAGSAYTKWELYDYYELIPDSSSSSMSNRRPRDDSDSIVDTRASNGNGNIAGTSNSVSSAKDDNIVFGAHVGVWVAIVGAVVLGLASIIAFLLCRRRSALAPTMVGKSTTSDIVMGRPVANQDVEANKPGAQGVVFN